MTVIRPNSVSGITSITAQANEINFFRSNGTLAGLQLNGVNFNTTTGVSTFNNLDVGGVLTYQDVTNVDSVGIITARSTIDAQGAINLADSIIHTGDTNTKIRFPADDTITAETAGSTRLRIHPDGGITIGSIAATTSKAGILHTRASTTTNPVVFENDTENCDVVIKTTGTNKHSILGFGDGANNLIGNIDYDHQNNSMVFDTNGGERLNISSSGVVTQVETGTGNGNGGIKASTASAGGNAGFGFITDGTQRFNVTTIGSAGSEGLRVVDNNNSAERLRITSHGGTVVNKGGSPNTASGWAGLEVKAAASEHQLVLSSTDTASNSNQVRLGFKLHPSNDNERVKAAIVCQGSGGGYGEVSRMMFCIDSVADNGNALPNSASDEKLRITSSGLIQIGGDISNVADIDTSNTKLTIKQSANNQEDGIYIERSGERRGHYIYVGGAHGTSDALCFSTNQLGGDIDILALDRSGDAYLNGDFLPNANDSHDLGSDAKTWRRIHYLNAYPSRGTQQSTNGSSFSSSSWYDTGFSRGSMGALDTNGVYIITLFADTWAAGGGNYSCNYTWIVGMRNQSTNQNTSNNIPLLSVTGHSTNNVLYELRTTRQGSVYGGNEWLQWRCTANLSSIDGSSNGRIMRWDVQRIGRSAP